MNSLLDALHGRQTLGSAGRRAGGGGLFARTSQIRPRRGEPMALTRRDVQRPYLRVANALVPPPVSAATISAHEPTLGERAGNALYGLAQDIGYSRVTADRMRSEASYIPILGDFLLGGDAASNLNRGNYLTGAAEGLLALAGLIPGAGDAAQAGGRALLRGGPRRTPDLPMDEASRMARAREQGFRPEPFYRGETDGVERMSGMYGRHFSRAPERAEGHAARGGIPAREFRIRAARPFVANGREISLRDYSDILRAAQRDNRNAGLVRELISGFPAEGQWSAARIHAAAARHPELGIMPGLGMRGAILRHAGDGEVSLLREAGFDFLDRGEEVVPLTGKGVRLATAAFDPRRWNSGNINAALAPIAFTGGLAGLYASQLGDTSGSNEER